MGFHLGTGYPPQSRLGLRSIDELMRDKRLRWFGHVERSDGAWIEKCRRLPKVEGGGMVGRPPKRWKEVLNSDFRVRGVSSTWAKDRDRWRAACRGDPFVHRAGADLSVLNNSACHIFYRYGVPERSMLHAFDTPYV